MGKTRTVRRLNVLQSFVKPRALVVKQSLCRCGFVLTALQTLGLILLYYTLSISLTFYNQRFIHRFRFPLSITMVHLTTKFIISVLIRWCLSCRSEEDRVILPWLTYCKCILPPGVFSSFDIGLSNWSFEFVTISLYTMTKSTVIVFILGFSILFRLEKPRCSLIMVILFIAMGLLLFTYESTQFSLHGFLLVLSASFLSGLRWTTSQLVMQQKDLGMRNPLDMMYHVQPWMMVALLPLCIGFESLHVATTEEVFGYKDTWHLLRNMALLFSGAFLAFMLEFTEFLLLQRTSSITLSISGIFKEICTLGLAVGINGDQMNPINALGLVICLIGITLHIVLKATVRSTTPPGIAIELQDIGTSTFTNPWRERVIGETDDEEEEHVIFDIREYVCRRPSCTPKSQPQPQLLRTHNDATTDNDDEQCFDETPSDQPAPKHSTLYTPLPCDNPNKAYMTAMPTTPHRSVVFTHLKMNEDTKRPKSVDESIEMLLREEDSGEEEDIFNVQRDR